MKKKILTLLATLGLLVGGVLAASPAQAASNWVINHSLSTCNAQYKDFNGTIRTLAPSAYSAYSVWMVRVPAGCTGEVSLAGQPQYILQPGVWKSFTSMFPSGSAATIYSHA